MRYTNPRGLPHDELGLLQPGVVLPVQMPGANRSAGGGERQLLLAVLADAVHCYRVHRTAVTKNEQQMFRESEEWIMSDDESSPFSFLNICQVLNIDAAYLRQGLSGQPQVAERMVPAPLRA